jgi:hypothetical protein
MTAASFTCCKCNLKPPTERDSQKTCRSGLTARVLDFSLGQVWDRIL